MHHPAVASGVRLLVFATIAIGVTTGVYLLTRDRISEQQQSAERTRIVALLPADSYDNDPLSDTVTVRAPSELGVEETTIHRAYLQEKPSALVLPVVAKDGYNGPIRLLLAVDAQARILGVEILEHRETPGLGDDIVKPWWREQFVGKSLASTPESDWTVKKHGGQFDQFTGATITPRAVVNAVNRALKFVTAKREELFAS